MLFSHLFNPHDLYFTVCLWQGKLATHLQDKVVAKWQPLSDFLASVQAPYLQVLGIPQRESPFLEELWSNMQQIPLKI